MIPFRYYEYDSSSRVLYSLLVQLVLDLISKKSARHVRIYFACFGEFVEEFKFWGVPEFRVE